MYKRSVQGRFLFAQKITTFEGLTSPYMKKILLAAAALACLMCAGCSGNSRRPVPELNYEELNAQALQEYLQPVHPGVRGKTPFWNGYSFKFIYAPAFDFDDVPGAISYIYSVTAGDKFLQFSAPTPRESLSQVWNNIPVGPVMLSVRGVDDTCGPVGPAQTRSFAKDNPFCGPYDPAPRDYLEAAIQDALYVHNSPIAQGWLKDTIPDMEYNLNCYPSKIWSGTIQTELFLASQRPEYREEAMQIARNAADALLATAQPADGPLPYLTPTYYCPEGVTLIWYIQRVIDLNRDNTMFVDAVMTAKAMLDIYDATGDKKYFDLALNIANTYKNLQAEDGSWPVKVNWNTGEPLTSARSMPTSILQLAQRLQDDYKVKGFSEMIAKTEAWLWDNTISTFNFNGQFEDVKVTDKAAYQNLTNCIAVDCIEYFLQKPKPTQKEIDACIQMARFAEDQFTRWHSQYDHHGETPQPESTYSPFVFEQYSFQCAIDASTAGVARAWMHIWEATGDPLALAKAKALTDTLVKVQDTENGCIPTSLDMTYKHDCTEDWSNCVYHVITTLVQLDGIFSRK